MEGTEPAGFFLTMDFDRLEPDSRRKFWEEGKGEREEKGRGEKEKAQ